MEIVRLSSRPTMNPAAAWASQGGNEMDTYRYRIIAIAIVGIMPVLCGCGRIAGPEGMDAQFSNYESAADPDGCVRNFVEAWESMDIDAYRNLVLYDGVLAADDGRVYEPFTFYFIDYARNPAHFQSYDEEVANVGRMFSGNPGKGGKVPGIQRISVTMHKNREWDVPTGETVLGDAYPPGTLRCVFDVAAFMELKSTIAGRDGQAPTGFTLNRRQEFYAIPVRVAGAQEMGLSEYRMWKWIELPH
jgi:hypothetical protein